MTQPRTHSILRLAYAAAPHLIRPTQCSQSNSVKNSQCALQRIKLHVGSEVHECLASLLDTHIHQDLENQDRANPRMRLAPFFAYSCQQAKAPQNIAEDVRDAMASDTEILRGQ